MRVLSLFDGMSCGMIAFLGLDIPIERYVAYEIDKYAVQTSKHNFPIIEQKGDVFDADYTEYEGFDFLVGGSPCTYWSIAQTKNREKIASGMGWELFSQYVRALKEAKPKYFLYENNKSMSKAIRDSITETFGFEPIFVNSALVSAQNRQRLYWCGIRQEDGTYRKADIEQPEDRGILLKDILETSAIPSNMVAEPIRIPEYGTDKARPINAVYQKNAGTGEGSLENRLFSDNPNKQQVDLIAEPLNITQDGKSQTIKAQYQQTSIANICGYTSTYGASGVAEPVNVTDGEKSHTLKAQYYKNAIANFVTNGGFGASAVAEPIRVGAMPNKEGIQTFGQGQRIYSAEGKAVPITTGQTKTGFYAISTDGKTKLPIYEVKDGKIFVKGKEYPIKLADGFYIIRKLSVLECMRLQTVPEWYEFPVSNSQAYKMLGNGWTIEVIKHLISGMLKEG